MASGVVIEGEAASGVPISVDGAKASARGAGSASPAGSFVGPGTGPGKGAGMGPGAVPGSSSAEQWDTPIDFEAAALELWRRRKIVLQAGVGALAAAILVALLLPPYYAATASFIPPSSGSSMSAGMAASLNALGASALLGGGKNSSELYLGILKSRSVADRMVDRFDLMKVYGEKKKSRARKSLAKATSFDSDVKNPIISIKVTDSSAERAREMANAYLEELRLASGGLAVTESSQRRLFYEQRLAKEKDDLADAEVALRQAEEKTGLIAPAGQMSSEIQAMAQARAEIAGREVELAALRQGATEENPDVIRLKAEIGGLRAHLAHMEGGGNSALLDSSGAGPRPQDSQRPDDLAASRVPGLELEYIRKAREVKYHEALFDIIARQYEAARLDEANNPPVLQVLDAAVLPDARAGPPRTVIAAAGMFLGLLGGSLWVLIQAARRRMARGPWAAAADPKAVA